MATKLKTFVRLGLLAITVLGPPGACLAQAQRRAIELNFTPAKTTMGFTLGSVLHTVHGSFAVKESAIHFDPATNKISGKILVDAASGQSGSDGRDRKMHKQVLESSRYPDIVFRPDRVDGQVSAAGVSTAQVHGIFSIHGADHEITIPVRVEMASRHWTASTHFSVPYVKWGMRNPSTFLLRVDQSVDIDIQASGDNP